MEQVLKAQRKAARVVWEQRGKAEGREAAAKVNSPEQLLRSFAETLELDVKSGKAPTASAS